MGTVWECKGRLTNTMYTGGRRKEVNLPGKGMPMQKLQAWAVREKDWISHSTNATLEVFGMFFFRKQKTFTAKLPLFPVTGNIHSGYMCSERIYLKKRLKNMLVTEKLSTMNYVTTNPLEAGLVWLLPAFRVCEEFYFHCQQYFKFLPSGYSCASLTVQAQKSILRTDLAEK